MTGLRPLRLVAAALLPLAAFADLGEDLLAAVRKGDAVRVKALLDQGATVDSKSPYGSTGLFFASDRGNLEIVKILLDHGADINVKDTFYGATALGWATEKQRVEIMQLLLSKGAKGVDDVLSTGVEKGNIEMVRLAIRYKTDLTAENLSEALDQATKNNRKEIAELLTAAGAKPLVHPNFPVALEVLKSYAGSYMMSDFEMKFAVVDGKLTGGEVGEKPAPLDPIDQTTFQHSEYPSLKMSFNVENGKVVSVTVRQGEGKPMIFQKAGGK
jgi:ankyrin repeat protein